jgi:hypothetical protein
MEVEKTPATSLKKQLLDRMSTMKTALKQKLSSGPFGTEESREQYEKRIMNDDSAWTSVSNKDRSILPR